MLRPTHWRATPRRAAAAAAAIGAAAFLAAASAAPADPLLAVLRLDPPYTVDPRRDFPDSAALVLILEDEATAAAFLKGESCASDSRHRRCQLLARREPDEGACLAVLIDTRSGLLKVSDFRIGMGATAKEAGRNAMRSSEIFDTLYLRERIVNPIRSITTVYEYVLDHDEEWLDRLAAVRCRGDP
jgi:hypothetical protein